MRRASPRLSGRPFAARPKIRDVRRKNRPTWPASLRAQSKTPGRPSPVEEIRQPVETIRRGAAPARRSRDADAATGAAEDAPAGVASRLAQGPGRRSCAAGPGTLILETRRELARAASPRSRASSAFAESRTEIAYPLAVRSTSGSARRANGPLLRRPRSRRMRRPAHRRDEEPDPAGSNRRASRLLGTSPGGPMPRRIKSAAVRWAAGLPPMVAESRPEQTLPA